MDDAAAIYIINTVFVKINQYKNEGEFLGWVRKIVINTCLNNIKQQTRFNTIERLYTKLH
jgi:RNA polymerase sigma-70 factor (ECF subfamily)